MKTFKSTSLLTRAGAVAAIAMLAAFAAPSADAVLLTYFNFNDSNTTADPPGAQLTTTIAPSAVNGVSGFTFNAGTTDNRATGDVQPGGQALTVTAGAGLANNNKSFEFTFSTLGFQDLVLSYSTKGTATGFNLQTIEYSVDGTNFFLLGTAVPTTTFATESFSFAAIPATDNDSSVTIRFTLSGASGTSGTNTFDNIQLNADPIPEPATVLGGLLGVAGLCFHQRRRLMGLLRLT